MRKKHEKARKKKKRKKNMKRNMANRMFFNLCARQKFKPFKCLLWLIMIYTVTVIVIFHIWEPRTEKKRSEEIPVILPGLPCARYAEKSRCDADCKALFKLLNSSTWRLEKAFIYVLTQRTRLDMLEDLIDLLNGHFRYGYPMVIFHEGDLFSKTEDLKKLAKRPLFFQVVNISQPTGVDPDQLGRDSECNFPPSYKNMCRFQAKCIYQQPIMKAADYTWRLDDDSRINADITYDLFQHMREGGYLYGYRFDIYDSTECTIGLWEAAQDYIDIYNITPSFFEIYHQPRIFYNNFEISKTSLWRTWKYRAYVNYLDSLLGIYIYRWGDAPIRSVYVSIAVKMKQLRWFGDLAYQHQGMDDGSTTVSPYTARKRILGEEPLDM